MNPLPVIASPSPTVAPAQPAQTFGQAFLTFLQVQASAGPGKPWLAVIKTRNYDAASGTLAPDLPANERMVSVPDIGALAVQFPVLGQTLGAVLTTAGLLLAWDAATQNFNNATKLAANDPTKPAAVAAASAALSAARVALGAAS